MKQVLNYTLQKLKDAGADHAACEAQVTEKHELNTETGQVKLFRTNENVQLILKYIKDQRQGRLAVNKYDESSIDQAVRNVVKLAEASPKDAAYDIAPKLNKEYQIGVLSPDLDQVYQSLIDFNKDVKEKYPKILGDAILSYDFKKRYIMNTNDLYVEEAKGSYNFTMMFSAKDQQKITSFNYTGASTMDLKDKLINLGGLDQLLTNTNRELDARSLGEKFVGDVIITPHCLEHVLSIYGAITVQDHLMISGTSQFKDKLNEKVASEKLNWYSKPLSIQSGYRVTGDHFEAEDTPIIEKGVLKSFLLSNYAGKKTGLGRSKNTGNAYVVEGGDQSIEDMIKSVDKGLLFCRFSGGMPGPDGMFSGIAKNSFYIEKGQVQFALTETMVTANIFDMFNNIVNISKEQIDFGESILPYIHTKGVTISSK